MREGEEESFEAMEELEVDGGVPPTVPAEFAVDTFEEDPAFEPPEEEETGCEDVMDGVVGGEPARQKSSNLTLGIVGS